MRVSPKRNKYPTSKGRIDFQDCDPLGHLNNTKYINYMMNARVEHLRQYYGLDIYDHTKDVKNAWVVSKNKIAYLRPVSFNEEVVFQSQVLYADSRRVMPQCIMMSADKGSLHAVLWAEFVYINTQTLRPTRHGEKLQELLDDVAVPTHLVFKRGSSNQKSPKLDELNFDEAVREIAREFGERSSKAASAR